MNKWKIIKETKPILLVAAHNYPHLREGLVKPRDVGTGEIVEKLAYYCECWRIGTTKKQEDPNWYPESSFRLKLKELIVDNKIEEIFDIHGRSRETEKLVEYYPNQSFLARYEHLLEGKVIKAFRDDSQLTISEDLDKDNIASLQVEIRRDGRDPQEDNYDKVYKELVDLLSSISNTVRE